MVTYIKNLAQQLLPVYQDQNYCEHLAMWLLEAVTKKGSAELLHYEPTDQEKKLLNQWLYEHVHDKKPLQYLIGSVPFAGCTLLVEPPILIPRPETEQWVCDLIAALQKKSVKKLKILDLCTGSGAIACAFAQAFPEALLFATDISEQALILARKNALLNNVTITFKQSDLFEALHGEKFDLILANPPYLSHAEWRSLEDDVRNWEDYYALVAPREGFELIERIIQQAPSFLLKNGQLLYNGVQQLYIEIGYKQAAHVVTYMKNYFPYVAVVQDYGKRDRVVIGGFQECGIKESLLP